MDLLLQHSPCEREWGAKNRFTTHFMKIVCCLMETRSELCVLLFRDDKRVFREYYIASTSEIFLDLTLFTMHTLCVCMLSAQSDNGMGDWLNVMRRSEWGFEQTSMIRKVDIWIQFEWESMWGFTKSFTISWEIEAKNPIHP